MWTAVEDAAKTLDKGVAHGCSARVVRGLPEAPHAWTRNAKLYAEVDEETCSCNVVRKQRVWIRAMWQIKVDEIELCVLCSASYPNFEWYNVPILGLSMLINMPLPSLFFRLVVHFAEMHNDSKVSSQSSAAIRGRLIVSMSFTSE